MKKQPVLRWFCLFAAVLMLSGCSTFRFEKMEEAQQREEDKNRVTAQSAAVNPADIVGEDLVFERSMKTKSGLVLASYSARVPQFAAEGSKSGIFENINVFYQQEFEAFADDCEWVFLTLQDEIGPGWNNITEEHQAVSSVFDYEMLLRGSSHLSFIRDYTYTDSAGRSSVTYFAEVFEQSTGWKIRFDDLFGDRAPQALEVAAEQLEKWCTKNSLAFDTRETVDMAQLVTEFALTDDELILCLSPFTLSADDAEGRLARLPLSAFEDLMQ